MKQQEQLIFAHFGEEEQRLKDKEERLELEIALNKLALYDVREEQGIYQEKHIVTGKQIGRAHV